MADRPAPFINLTPHEIVIECPDGQRMSVPPDGDVLRIETQNDLLGTTSEGIPIHWVKPSGDGIDDGLKMLRKHRARVTGVEVFVIVSGLALDWLAQSDRMTEGEHLYTICPDTGPHSAVRDESGRIVAVRAFRVGRQT